MTTKTKAIPKTQERRVSLVGSEPNAEARSVRAALSSKAPVRRFFGTEVLVHRRGSINLSRAADNGLPLLVNHNDEAMPLGRVRNIELESDGVLRGDLEFSDATEAARDAWSLVSEGTLSDVSIRYTIDKHRVENPDSSNPTYQITEWTPLEASVVSVPADPTVGIGRQHDDEGTVMPEENPEAPQVPETPNAVTAARARNVAAEEAGEQRERERIGAIEALAANFGSQPVVEELARDAKASGTSVSDFKEALILALAGEPATPLARSVPQPELSRPAIRMPTPMEPQNMRISAGSETQTEHFYRDLEQAFDVRARNLAEKDAKDNPFLGLSCAELARMSLEQHGISTRSMTPLDVCGQVLTRFIDPGTANLTTASYTAVLENVLNKALFRGFEEAPVTWNRWCGTDSSPDFKQGSRPGVSQFTSLAEVAENAQIQDGITTDKKEVFQVRTFARKYSITRQALVNDDLAALSDTAAKMGQAAGRTVDEQVYAFIVANGNMNEDSNPLFDAANHNNLVSAAGAPSTDNISTARTNMGRQTDWNNVILGIVPQYMVVPLELERVMLELQSVITGLDPDATSQMRDNVYRTMWEPVATPRLSDANDWYMFGQRGQAINVVFLNGAQRPMMARDEGWSVLAAHWRVVLDFDVMAVDWRAAIKFTNV